MQRHIALGRRPRQDNAKARPWPDLRSAPGTVEVLGLAKYRLASRWQSLIWFWLCILAAAAVLGLVLEILGPPERDVRLQLQPEPPQAQPALAAKPTPPVAPGAARLPAVPAAVRPEPAQPSPPAPNVPPPNPAARSNTPPDTPPRGRVMLVLHPARPENGTAMANRLAAQTGLATDQVEVGPVAEARPEAVIRFYSTEDHPLARRLGKELARMGYTWRIENFAARSWAWKDQAVEVFLPDR